MTTLKKLNIDHIDAIIAFDRLCFPTDFWNKDDWADLLNDPRAIYYALLEDEAIVGDVFIYNWNGERDYVKIMNLAVHPNYRRRGLAHRLLQHVTAEMNAVGMNRFSGETRASNKSMQRVFEDCGYALRDIEKDYFEHPVEGAYKYILQL